MLSLSLSFLIAGLLMVVGVSLTAMQANRHRSQLRKPDGRVTPPT